MYTLKSELSEIYTAMKSNRKLFYFLYQTVCNFTFISWCFSSEIFQKLGGVRLALWNNLQHTAYNRNIECEMLAELLAEFRNPTACINHQNACL